MRFGGSEKPSNQICTKVHACLLMLSFRAQAVADGRMSRRALGLSEDCICFVAPQDGLVTGFLSPISPGLSRASCVLLPMLYSMVTLGS